MPNPPVWWNGRHRRLKISRQQCRTGSSPVTGTTGTVKYRGVEQLVARRAHNPEVGGSSPPSATNKKNRKIIVFNGFAILFLQSMQKWAYSLNLSSLRLRCRLAFRAVTVSVMILFHPRYHRLTRANTPASVSFQRFLPFSPWRAPARLRLKSQKSLEDPSLAGAGSFAGAEMCSGKERPAENTAVLSRDLTPYGRISVRQNRVCPRQSMVQSATRSESQLFRPGRALHLPCTAPRRDHSPEYLSSAQAALC